MTGVIIVYQNMILSAPAEHHGQMTGVRKFVAKEMIETNCITNVMTRTTTTVMVATTFAELK